MVRFAASEFIGNGSRCAGDPTSPVGARDAKRDKPAPDPIFLALDGTGIAPDHSVWMVGDTPGDLKCAHAAGVLPVYFGSVEIMSERLREFPPVLHARDCHELAALL